MESEIHEEQYPENVTTPKARHRWNLATAMAQGLGLDEASTWAATRALFNSDIPTDPPANPSEGVDKVQE